MLLQIEKTIPFLYIFFLIDKNYPLSLERGFNSPLSSFSFSMRAFFSRALPAALATPPHPPACRSAHHGGCLLLLAPKVASLKVLELEEAIT